jgi:hypothetical protein
MPSHVRQRANAIELAGRRKLAAQNWRNRRRNKWERDRLSAIIPRDTFRFGRNLLESEGIADAQ